MEKWENPAIINENQLPAHVDLAANAVSLNGKWKFCCRRGDEELPLNFFQTGFDDSQWELIDVPCCWETRGYGYPCYNGGGLPTALSANASRIPLIEQKKNYIGYYRRHFTLPADFEGKQVTVRFGAAKSALLVWVNGRYAGMSKGSMVPAEFDITKLLKPGENLIAARVYQFSDASYLENQDMWALSGLYRDVELYALPQRRLTDLYAKASFSGSDADCELSVQIHAENADGLTVRVAVLDGNNVAYYGEGIIKHGQALTRIHCPNAKLWSAETPKLYRIAVILWDGQNICHTLQTEFGFREIKIENAQLKINGRPLKFRGVNYPAFTPEHGYYVPEETLRRDLATMKRFNINAVRTGGCPQSEAFYRICDEYGIYVIDECNMDCYISRDKNIPGDNPLWTAHVTDRMERMVLRDRNHACVCVWGLGRGSMGENFAKMKLTALALDDSRPFVCESDSDLTVSDLCCDSYPTLERVRQFANQQDLTEKNEPLLKMGPDGRSQKAYSYEAYCNHPILATRFACQMGNCATDLAQYADIFETSDQWCGGFIWDYKDKALLSPAGNGTYLRHGGDQGLKLQSGTASCCGLTDPHGREHQGFYEVQKAYQSFSCTRLESGNIRITNRSSFLSSAHCECGYELTRDGCAIECGLLRHDIPPRSSEEFAIPLADPMVKPGRYHLTLRFTRREATPYAPAGTLAAYEQWEIAHVKHIPDENPGGSIRDDGNYVYLRANDCVYTLNRATGNIEQIQSHGTDLLTGPLEPAFYRPMTDSDAGFVGLAIGALKRKDEWAKLTLKKALPKPSIFQVDHMTHAVTVSQTVGAGLMRSYRLMNDGSLTVELRLRTGKRPPNRIGMQCQLSRELEQLSWFGRGPYDTYQGRETCGLIANHTMRVNGQDEHLRPQEHGNKQQVYSLSLTDGQGHGIHVRAQESISASVWPYTPGELDQAEQISSLPEHIVTTLNLDMTQNGLGDCYVPCPDSYKIQPNSTYTYSFTIIPL